MVGFANITGGSPRSLPPDAIAGASSPSGQIPYRGPTNLDDALKEIFGTQDVPRLKNPLVSKGGSQRTGACWADALRSVLLKRIHDAHDKRLPPEERRLLDQAGWLFRWSDPDAKNIAVQDKAMKFSRFLNAADYCEPTSSRTSLQGAVDHFIQQHRHVLLK